MEEIVNWFHGLKQDWPEDEEVIDKIVEGISDTGFNSKHIDALIEEQLDAIQVKYKEEFVQIGNDKG